MQSLLLHEVYFATLRKSHISVSAAFTFHFTTHTFCLEHCRRNTPSHFLILRCLCLLENVFIFVLDLFRSHTEYRRLQESVRINTDSTNAANREGKGKISTVDFPNPIYLDPYSPSPELYIPRKPCIHRVLNSHIPVFPRSYVPRTMYSHNHVFPGFYIPHNHVFLRTLYSQDPVYPEHYIPRVTYSRVLIFQFPLFPDPYIPRTTHSQVSIFPETYVPKNPIYPGSSIPKTTYSNNSSNPIPQAFLEPNIPIAQ